MSRFWGAGWQQWWQSPMANPALLQQQAMQQQQAAMQQQDAMQQMAWQQTQQQAAMQQMAWQQQQMMAAQRGGMTPRPGMMQNPMVQRQQQMMQQMRQLSQRANAAVQNNPELAEIISAIGNQYQTAMQQGYPINPQVSQMVRANINAHFGGRFTPEQIEQAWQAMHPPRGMAGMNIGNWVGLAAGGLLGFSLMSGGGILTTIIGAAIGAIGLSWVGGMVQNQVAPLFRSSTPQAAAGPTTGPSPTTGGPLPPGVVEYSPVEPPNPGALPRPAYAMGGPAGRTGGSGTTQI